MLSHPRQRFFLALNLFAFASLGVAQTPAVTQIMYNDPSITYTGTWYMNYETPNIGGSSTLTNDKGATVKLTFTGTGISWLGVMDPYSGIAQLYLDGTPYTVDSYASNTEYAQPIFSVHGLAAGTHTLSIEVLHQRDGETDGSWIWVNAFNIENGGGVTGGVTASSGTIQQNDPSITYTGNWYLNSNPANSGGTAVLAMDVNSSATITFNGTSITWVGYQDAWSGIANIYVDGQLQSTPQDTYSATEKSQSNVLTISGLTPGPHTLMIFVTGNHDAASAGSWIWIDAFKIGS